MGLFDALIPRNHPPRGGGSRSYGMRLVVTEKRSEANHGRRGSVAEDWRLVTCCTHDAGLVFRNKTQWRDDKRRLRS